MWQRESSNCAAWKEIGLYKVAAAVFRGNRRFSEQFAMGHELPRTQPGDWARHKLATRLDTKWRDSEGKGVCF